MKHLRENEHIIVTDEGHIKLTNSGRSIAEKVYERHEFLSSWFISLGVPEEIALEDACKMEHVLSNESFDAIKIFVNKINIG